MWHAYWSYLIKIFQTIKKLWGVFKSILTNINNTTFSSTAWQLVRIVKVQSTPSTISEESAEINTPISKRDKLTATSPLDALEADSKKLRNQPESHNTRMTGVDDTADATISFKDSSVHLFSRPMNPADIVKMATELRSLMLPQISNLIKVQLPDIQFVDRVEVD